MTQLCEERCLNEKLLKTFTILVQKPKVELLDLLQKDIISMKSIIHVLF